MQAQITGPFTVKITPQPQAPGEGPVPGRMLLDKIFEGPLTATSQGQMLAWREPGGSGGYVAMELVTGTLEERKGSFVLQHSGSMTRGAPQLTLTVVPDSGSGELLGLAGSMAINIVDGKHQYDFSYTLPDLA